MSTCGYYPHGALINWCSIHKMEGNEISGWLFFYRWMFPPRLNRFWWKINTFEGFLYQLVEIVIDSVVQITVFVTFHHFRCWTCVSWMGCSLDFCWETVPLVGRCPRTLCVVGLVTLRLRMIPLGLPLVYFDDGVFKQHCFLYAFWFSMLFPSTSSALFVAQVLRVRISMVVAAMKKRTSYAIVIAKVGFDPRFKPFVPFFAVESGNGSIWG